MIDDALALIQMRVFAARVSGRKWPATERETGMSDEEAENPDGTPASGKLVAEAAQGTTCPASAPGPQGVEDLVAIVQDRVFELQQLVGEQNPNLAGSADVTQQVADALQTLYHKIDRIAVQIAQSRPQE